MWVIGGPQRPCQELPDARIHDGGRPHRTGQVYPKRGTTIACRVRSPNSIPARTAQKSIDSANAGEENGLLQVWEIFEQLRIDADLVTLSACETALGDDVAGEGLIGLTRAFHYAGARTVLASLWALADDSTSDLMTKVYGTG